MKKVLKNMKFLAILMVATLTIIINIAIGWYYTESYYTTTNQKGCIFTLPTDEYTEQEQITIEVEEICNDANNKSDSCSYCKSMHGPMRVSVIDANSEGNSTIFTGYRIHEDDVIVDKEHQKVFDDTSYVEFDYNYYIEHQTLIPLYQDGLPKKLDVCEMLIYDAVTRDYYFEHIA